MYTIYLPHRWGSTNNNEVGFVGYNFDIMQEEPTFKLKTHCKKYSMNWLHFNMDQIHIYIQSKITKHIFSDAYKYSKK